MFDKFDCNELDVLITGLRLVRRGAYDDKTRLISSILLGRAQRAKRDKLYNLIMHEKRPSQLPVVNP